MSFKMEIQNTSAPPNTLQSGINVRWECKNISTQQREIDDTNSQVIGLVVNACRNVIANTFLYLNLGENSLFVWSMCFIQLKICLIYIANMFIKFIVIDGEYIVKISSGV